MKEKRSFTVRGSVTKSRFTRKKFAVSQFTGNKKGLSRVTKKPFTTLCIALAFAFHAHFFSASLVV